jgi:beta-N-acetylhexosaminidase
VRDVPAGAILLLGYNIAESPEKIMKLNAAFQKTAAAAGKGIPFLIALDHEGGTVYRLGAAATRIPGAARVGALLRKTPGTAEAAAFTEDLRALYTASARQLALLGFSLNLAPVLEPLSAANRDFLRYRSYGDDPRTVSLAGGIFTQAMREGGILAAGKHFPGTGGGDPHKTVTRLELGMSGSGDSSEEDFSPLLFPFRAAINAGGLSALMVSHALVPELDPLLPVSLSAPAISFIRRRLGFEGIILTDDINMRAVSGGRGAGDAAVAALAAGADMIMYLDERGIAAVHSHIVSAVREGRLPEERLHEAAARVLEQKILLNLWKRSDDIRRAAEDPHGLFRRSEEFSRLKQEGDGLLKRIDPPSSPDL